MKEIRLKARAKINLTLDVTGKREDGYHLLETIMQTVALYDGIYMKKLEKPEIRLKTNLPWLPVDERNLAYRAAQLMRETFGIKGGVFIEIDKRIPVAAGLAGGSTDCAAVLVGMNRLYELGLSEEELEALAGRMGSDIPYCVRRGTVLCEGVGEKMTNVADPCPRCYVVLAKLPVSVSTVSVYKGLKWDQVEEHPDTQAMLSAMAEGDVKKMGSLLCNVLETVTIEMHPKIAKIKKRLMELGAAGALMSGSGPTVFGLFSDREQARQAAAQVKREFALKEAVATRVYRVQREVRGEKRNG
ncbi:MAG: 4-(cytidine 5'-diphospho)-2-C-methyl-D-erythritol kinase [Bacillota bacterium]|nr:4-(cytidine 5'-diphospho)-2-C-methyl-D-erythritol kinase [Bacillota bacterium]